MRFIVLIHVYSVDHGEGMRCRDEIALNSFFLLIIAGLSGIL